MKCEIKFNFLPNWQKEFYNVIQPNNNRFSFITKSIAVVAEIISNIFNPIKLTIASFTDSIICKKENKKIDAIILRDIEKQTSSTSQGIDNPVVANQQVASQEEEFDNADDITAAVDESNKLKMIKDELKKKELEEISKLPLVEDSNPKKVYDQQIILNLGSGDSARGLTAKRLKKYGKDSTTVDLTKKKFDLSCLSTLTPDSRLYIIGHSYEGVDYIESDGDKKVTVNEFVDMLVKHAPQLQQTTSPEKRIKISLVSCLAGLGIGDEKSCAYRLSQELSAKGIHADVYGRTGNVSRWYGKNDENYLKQVNDKHHADRSKLMFATEQGVTIVSAIKYN